MRNNYLNDIIIVATIHSFYTTHVDNNNNMQFHDELYHCHISWLNVPVILRIGNLSIGN